MLIGHHRIEPALVLAPMAGVTDLAFRSLCRRHGAGLAVSEMTISDPAHWDTPKSRVRMDHRGEPGPVSVQIAGGDPGMLAEAARHNVALGADIIDINMGCPAKKVCRVDAGSALLRDVKLVEQICRAVVAAVDVPVTLKIRTGWTRVARNGLQVARIAEDCGIAALAVHGRARDDRFDGEAEFETAARIKQSVRIPVLANGDIDSPQKAAAVLALTAADGLMIGRGALGRPWIFHEIQHFLSTGKEIAPPPADEVGTWLTQHLDALYALYGERTGVRVARKHIQWYCARHPGADDFWGMVNRVEDVGMQRGAVEEFFGNLARPALRAELPQAA